MSRNNRSRAICPFFAHGYCKYGNKCYGRHPYQNDFFDLRTSYYQCINNKQCSNKNCEYIIDPDPSNKKGTCCVGCSQNMHTTQCITRTQNSITSSWQ